MTEVIMCNAIAQNAVGVGTTYERPYVFNNDSVI